MIQYCPKFLPIVAIISLVTISTKSMCEEITISDDPESTWMIWLVLSEKEEIQSINVPLNEDNSILFASIVNSEQKSKQLDRESLIIEDVNMGHLKILGGQSSLNYDVIENTNPNDMPEDSPNKLVIEDLRKNLTEKDCVGFKRNLSICNINELTKKVLSFILKNSDTIFDELNKIVSLGKYVIDEKSKKVAEITVLHGEIFNVRLTGYIRGTGEDVITPDGNSQYFIEISNTGTITVESYKQDYIPDYNTLKFN